jgi:hypothetical protein
VGDLILYLIDTDVLVAIRKKKDSDRIYSHPLTMASQGDLKTVRQVFDELKSFGRSYAPVLNQRAKYLLPIGEQYSVAVQDKIEVLKQKAGYLWEQTGSGDPADPWLIAAASTLKYTLVTNESKTSPKRIPAACNIPETHCRCISGPHFLVEIGLVKTINPAHISVDAFFSDPG